VEFVVEVIRERFSERSRIVSSLGPDGKLLKIVLFGSYAPGIGWTIRWGGITRVTICSSSSIMRI
jgi:hypothetical protein